MSKPTSPSVRRGFESLENRQLFAGVAASERVFFPNPQAVAQFVAIERAIAIDFGSGYAFMPRFGHGWNGDSSDNSGSTSNNPSNNTPNSGSSPTVTTPVSTPAAGSNDTTTAAAASNTTSRSTLSFTAAPTAVANDAASQVQMTTPDATPVAVVRAIDSDAKPAAATNATPIVVAVTGSTPKVFSDHAVPVRFAASTTATQNMLPNLLTSPVTGSKANQLAVSTPVHHETTAAATEESQVAMNATAEKGAQIAILATIPTANVFSQPLWQRIAAASATVVILAANWVLRRKRENLAAAGRRRA